MKSKAHLNAMVLSDQQSLLEIMGIASFESFQKTHRDWVDTNYNQRYRSVELKRDTAWFSSLAMGTSGYVQNVKEALGISG